LQTKNLKNSEVTASEHVRKRATKMAKRKIEMAELTGVEKFRKITRQHKNALGLVPMLPFSIGRVKEKSYMKITCWLFMNMCRVNLLPFSWDSKNCRFFKSRQYKSYLILWLISICFVNWALCGFIMVRFAQTVAHHWKHVQRKELSAIIGMWPVMAFQIIVAFNTREIATHLDIIMHLTNRLSTFRRKSTDTKLWADFKGAKVMAFLFVIRNFQQIITGCLRAQRPQYLYSVLPHEWRNYYTYFLYCLFTVYNSFSTWMVMYGTFSMLNFVETFEYLLSQK
ncbi:unnamed protein product, partial [Allacma fusca]